MNWRIITRMNAKGGKPYLQITNDIDTIDFVPIEEYYKLIGKRNIFCPKQLPKIIGGIYAKEKTRLSKSCNSR
jgi:hypothetical protein